MMLVAKPKLISSVTFNISTFTSWGDYRSCIGGAVDGESVVSSWRRIAPWCCLVRWCRGKYIADKSWFLLLSNCGPHLLELSLIWNLLELVDGRCFFRQSTLERDVMENTVQAGTPA